MRRSILDDRLVAKICRPISRQDWGLGLPTGARLAFDTDENPVVLFANDWSVNYFREINPKIPLEKLPPAAKSRPD